MIREIITDPEKLSIMSGEVDVRKDNKLVQFIVRCLIDTIKEHNLKGLSAIQIGYDKRIFAINFNGNIKIFINPGITNCEKQGWSRETCASIPGKQFIVPRYAQCDVMAMNANGEPILRQLSGVAAYVYQHYLDHLEGILLSDFALEIDDDFDTAPEEDKIELLKWYAENIGIKIKETQSEIDQDEDLKTLQDAIKFEEARMRGEIEFDGTVTEEKKKDKEDSNE